MTRDDAITLTEWILNNWARPEWTPAQVEAYVGALLPYDAEIATLALTDAHRTLNYRPPFAEFFGFYRARKADAASRQHTPPQAPTKKNRLPFWIKRWVVARHLAPKFGREVDMRRFVEQGEWADPDDPLMPAEEWVREAEAITDRNALRAIAP